MTPITLRVLCEGQTERNFVTQILMPHLRAFHVFARPELLQPGQGGVIGWERLRDSIKAEVGRSRKHMYVTTIIDLYAIGKYPGVEALAGESAYERTARIEAEMARGLPNPRFLPYIQMHEFEALVLVDVSHLPAQFPDGEANEAPRVLRASVGDTPPELVNDGANSAPSKRIISAVPLYRYLKPIAGPAVTRAIGLPRLREACPHFNEWVTRLEHIGDRAEDT